jgi:hypothetical protein
VAVPDAVRRSGSLLVRALTVGGLATAAWLVCAGFASAGEDHSDEVAKTLDAVNVALGEQQAATVDLFADALTVPPLGLAAVDQAPPPELHPFEGPLTGPAVVVTAPLPLPYSTAGQTYSPYSDDPSADDPSAADTEYGYTYYGNSRSGSVSNTMPAPLYEAKVAAKAAARAAAAAALAPPPAEAPAVPSTVPAPAPVLPMAAEPSAPGSAVAANAEVVREVPTPGAPAPAPQQVPVPASPTASSSSGADGGGGHRGGLIASFTAQSDPKPSAAWSAERPGDGRSPGSVPGLPSTSPD